jgi:hypothetical protein
MTPLGFGVLNPSTSALHGACIPGLKPLGFAPPLQLTRFYNLNILDASDIF